MSAASPRTFGHPAFVACLALAATLLLGCAQLPSTAQPPPTQAPGSLPGGAPVAPAGPILATVTVWLDEHGILLWTPRLDAPGAYAFEVHNRGREPHDFTVVQWEGEPDALPQRSGRVLLQGLDVVARTSLLGPDEEATVVANLDPAGAYTVLSSEGVDYGAGMLSTLAVGGAGGAGLAAPEATPPPGEDQTVRVYVVDRAIYVSRDDATSGEVTLLVQNIGPSAHDVVVVRWRGDEEALPVNTQGEVLLDGLIVVARLGPIEGGAEDAVQVEMEDDYAYVVFSSLPGDYAAGMRAQITTR